MDAITGSSGRRIEGPGYEWTMVLVTSLAISLVAFDRLATGYLAPFLLESLQISKTQLGTVYSIQAMAVAVTGFLVGHFSDRSGKRKQVLVPVVVLASLCAVAALFVQGYAMLLVVRFASGLALGGITPICQSVVTSQSTPARLGRNIGLQTLLMLVVAQGLGPIVLPAVAARFGWQAGFFVSAIPFLLIALAVALLVREPQSDPAAARADTLGADPTLSPQARRTLFICMIIAVCFMVWLVVHSTFLSVFLVERLHLSPTGAGAVMAPLGIAGGIGGMVLPMLSDRIGRRPVLLIGMGLATIVPLALLTWQGPVWGLQICLFIGWMAIGALPIYAMMIPGEVIPASRMAATVGITTGAGEIIGGVGSPILAGKLADSFGIGAPFWLALAMAVCSVGLSLLLLFNPAPDKS